MRVLRDTTLPAVLTLICLAAVPFRALAEDIDIFEGTSGRAADVPNVIFLIDNSPNWSRTAQKWPDSGGVQGVAELAAISAVLSQITTTQPANVGVAMLTPYAGASGSGNTPGAGGAYIRFGVRDMTVAGNRTALQNILGAIESNVNNSSEKLSGSGNKDEDAAFFEIYKYLSGLAPFTGPYGTTYAKQNGKVDVAGNTDPNSAAGQGLTSGFSLANGVYQTPLSPLKPCQRTYIIYIANNSQGGQNNPSPSDVGLPYYQQAVADVDPRLAATPGWDTWTDEWTKFLYSNGVVVPTGNNNGSVVTYVLDAFNAQQNVSYSDSLANAAKMGGGKYYQVGSQQAIQIALAQILEEIQAVNTSFASASLPVNATNRAQNDNQVFIPMFRPDPSANPRWMGNLKQYQIINLNGETDLGDSSSTPINAINLLTGFFTACATSFWTTDSGSYWSSVPESPSPKGTCPTTTNNAFSDAPDGPVVEKGGVAEIVRKGNNPPTTNTAPTWAVNRTLYTLSGLSGTSLTPFTAAGTGLPSSLVNWIVGQDVLDENGNSNVTETRPSLHGDEIHSRPMPVDYGGTTGVTVFYGSNDGTLRAVDAATGRERWAFIPPEFYTPAPAVPPATPTGLARLMNDSPLISYPGYVTTGITPTPVKKDYYFDGTAGILQPPGTSSVFLYPTMRRGGRMLYALDVSDPTAPAFKWKKGCPDLADDTGCSAGMSGIGQTWSTPMGVVKIQGYTGNVVIMGGGYDPCEDANTASPSCSSPKGAAIYVFDADTGALLKSFSTTRSVVADIALIGIADPNTIDHAYAVDTGGNIYRIDFGTSVSAWTMNRVAYTNGAGRKFLYAPALVPVPGGKVYLALGSGDREHPLQSQYPYGGVTNRFYVYVDDLSSTRAISLDDTTVMSDYTTASSCTTAQVLPGETMRGWFMDLDQYGEGEQTVTSAVVVSALVYFSTNRPIPPSQGSCSTALGEARGYVVNLFNASGAIGVGGSCGGQRTGIFIGGGLPPSPVVVDVPVSNVGANTTTWETVIIGGMDRSQGGDGSGSSNSGTPSCGPLCTQTPGLTVPPTRHQVYWKSSGQN